MKAHIQLSLLLLFLILVTQANAQRIGAYIAAGSTASQIEGDELKGFEKWGFAGSVGALARISDNDRWFASLEAGYARRGAFENTVNPYKAKFVMDYIDVPLTIFYKDPYGGLMIGAGLVYGRLFRQPYGDMSIVYKEWTETTYHKDNNGVVIDSTMLFKASGFRPDTTDLSFLKNDLSFALELRFCVWKNLNFSLRYQRSIIPVKKDWQFVEGHNTTHIDRWTNNCYNSSIMARLVWLFGLDDEPASQSHKRRR